MTRVYLAGPMTNHPHFNIPEFDRVADILRRAGYDVISPTELDNPAIRAISLASPDGAIATLESHGMTHGQFLARDVALIADDGIEAIVVLPGWETSKGARHETFVAFLEGMPILSFTEHPSGITLNQLSMMELTKGWTGLTNLYSHSVYEYMSVGANIPAVEYE